MEEERWVERGTEMERIIYFSDAVFAIAITLLVLEIRVPDGLTPAELADALTGLWPKFVSYAVSFSVIGIYWIAHHRIFHYVKAYDRRLILLNLLFLMCVAFVPFPVSLLGEYGGQGISIAIYAGSFAAAGSFLSGMWWYATRDRRLIDDDLDERLIRHVQRESLFTPVAALIVMADSFLSATVAVYAFLLLLLIRLVQSQLLPRLRARLRAQEPANEPGKGKEAK